MSINKVILVGYVGKDPEIRYLKERFSVANFSLATTHTVGKTAAGGAREEQTEWHRIVAFGEQAAFAEQWVRKGSLLAVEGRISYRNYTDKQGTMHSITEIVAERLHFVGNPPREYSQALK